MLAVYNEQAREEVAGVTALDLPGADNSKISNPNGLDPGPYADTCRNL